MFRTLYESVPAISHAATAILILLAYLAGTAIPWEFYLFGSIFCLCIWQLGRSIEKGRATLDEFDALVLSWLTIATMVTTYWTAGSLYTAYSLRGRHVAPGLSYTPLPPAITPLTSAHTHTYQHGPPGSPYEHTSLEQPLEALSDDDIASLLSAWKASRATPIGPLAPVTSEWVDADPSSLPVDAKSEAPALLDLEDPVLLPPAPGQQLNFCGCCNQRHGGVVYPAADKDAEKKHKEFKCFH